MKLRRLLILLGFVGIVIAIISSVGDPHKLIHAFTKVQWYVVPLLIGIQIISYYCNAKYYQVFYAIANHKVKLSHLYQASLGIQFANMAVPSGGVAGTAYLAEVLKPYGVPTAKSTLAQVGSYIFSFLSYFVVLGFGFLMLFFAGNLNKVSVRLVVLLMIIILIVGMVLLALFSEQSRFQAVLTPFVRFVNRFGRVILRRKKPLVNRDNLSDFLSEFYHGYHEIMSHKGKWPSLFWWSLGGNIAEVSTIYAVFVSFGWWVNPGVVITGYTLAIIASIGGLIINGLGVYEAGMIGTFAALGIPFAVAFAVVIVYRVLNMAIFLPVGFYFYKRQLEIAT